MPFNISCGHCWMCGHGLQSQCETTQVHEQGTGAALFGYTKLYGQVAGGQAEYLRVPQAQYGPIKVPEGPPDERFLFLSDVLPTAWQAVEYARSPRAGRSPYSVSGPSARWRAHRPAPGRREVFGIDLVAERLEHGRTPRRRDVDLRECDDLGAELRERTGGRGPDSVIDAVGMEAHGSPVAKAAQHARRTAARRGRPRKLMQKAGVDRLAALLPRSTWCAAAAPSRSAACTAGRRPAADAADVRQAAHGAHGPGERQRWVDDILPLLTDDDPLGVHDLVTHQRSPRRGARGLRDVPEEVRRRGQGRVQALIGVPSASLSSDSQKRKKPSWSSPIWWKYRWS